MSKSKIKDQISKIIKKNVWFIFLLLLSLFPLLDLLKPGLPLTHDGQDHVARIANFYQSLTEGNIVPRWAGNLNWGYGHPVLMFLYPLPSYIASLFHVLGFSFIDSVKAVFGLTFVLSGVAIYIWTRKFLGDLAGIAAGILYMFAPYRFVDLYVRGAIGEHVAFLFLPLILYFFCSLSERYSYRSYIGAVLSLAGLFLSHNALSIMFLPIILFYAIYLIYVNNKSELIYQYASILVLGFGISSFFLVPAFFEGRYTLRDIVTAGEYSSRFVDFKSLIYGQWSYGGTGQFTVQLGLINWLLVGFSSVFLLISKNSKKNILYDFLFIYFAISIFLMLKQSDLIWRTFTTLEKFQFPWRFLSVSVFCAAVLGGLSVSLVSKKYQKLFLIAVAVLSVFLTKDFFHANGYLQKTDEFYSGIYNGTTDTGESSPVWSVRFMEKRPKQTVEVIGGIASINATDRNSTRHDYVITSITEKAQIRDNTLYFPGWNVFVDGVEVPMQFQDQQNRGVITFFIDKGKHDVNVVFQDTRLRKTANVISLLSFIILFSSGSVIYFIRKLKTQNANRKTKT